MRGYRPSYFVHSPEPDASLTAPDRAKRIVIYIERAANGLPLFESPVEVPVNRRFGRLIKPRARAG